MPLRVNVAGTYRPVIGAWIHFQNSWRRLNSIYIRTGGLWRLAFKPEMDLGVSGETRYNVNLYEEYRKYTGDNSGSPVGFKFNINCNVGSNQVWTAPALDCSTFPEGSNIIIQVNGWIIGRAGDGQNIQARGNYGSSGASFTGGSPGGDAIKLRGGCTYEIYNNYVIGGGGGGGMGSYNVITGGCGYSYCTYHYGAAGNGGAGTPNGGAAGSCTGFYQYQVFNYNLQGSAGSLWGGNTGWYRTFYNSTSVFNKGGAGGSLGQAARGGCYEIGCNVGNYNGPCGNWVSTFLRNCTDSRFSGTNFAGGKAISSNGAYCRLYNYANVYGVAEVV